MTELGVENGALKVLNSRIPNVRGVQARSRKRTVAIVEDSFRRASEKMAVGRGGEIHLSAERQLGNCMRWRTPPQVGSRRFRAAVRVDLRTKLHVAKARRCNCPPVETEHSSAAAATSNSNSCNTPVACPWHSPVATSISRFLTHPTRTLVAVSLRP